MTASEQDLARALFGPDRRVRCLMAFVDGAAIGLALYFYTFSTFLGKLEIYLEHLFVEPEWCGERDRPELAPAPRSDRLRGELRARRMVRVDLESTLDPFLPRPWRRCLGRLADVPLNRRGLGGAGAE